MEVKTIDVYQAISDPNRRRLLELLRKRECAVQDLVPHLGITVGAVSQHLQLLHRSGLVSREKRGRFRYYRIRRNALREVHEWTDRYREFWSDSLDRLGDYLDEQE